MSKHHPISEYSLLILDKLLSQCTTISELRSAIASYPEDTRREGHVIKDMEQFVASFPDFATVASETQRRVADRGGREEMERFRDRMEFDEFMSGSDE
jgi:hypothetical protein